MNASRRLAAVSAAQLAFGLAGLAVALPRRHSFDLPGWRGAPDKVGRDALWMGTALSAPGPMLVAQAVSTAVLARQPHTRARRTIGLLGAAMTVGYPIERLVRQRLTRGGWDPLESTLAAGGLALAVVMAAGGASGD